MRQGPPKKKPLSPSARALAEILDEWGPTAAKVRETVAPAQLSKYRRGLGVPNAITAGDLHRVTEGRVPAHTWGLVEEPTQPGTQAA